MPEANDGATLVNTGAGVPLHRQLYLVLHDEIARGALAVGAALPTEQALCEQFGVSRITVRRALADLAEAGLVERRHGVGSFVTKPAERHHDPRGSYLDGLRQIQFETSVDVLEVDVRPVPAVIAARLGGLERALYVLRVRRSRGTGEAFMISEAWLPASLERALSAPALAGAPLYELLHGAGVVVEGIDHELTAEVAGPRVAALLAMAIGSAVIRVNSVINAGGAPHHFLSIALSPSRSRVMLSQTAAEFEAGTGLAIAHDVQRPVP